jgi:hypothetical protein
MVRRMLLLTPYGLETIIEDGKRAGRAARLQITVPAGTPAPALRSIRSVFERLGAAGVGISVLHEESDEGGDDERAPQASTTLSGDRVSGLCTRLIVMVRRPLHELQRERILVALLAASRGHGWTAERLQAQANETDRAAARLEAFVAAHRYDLPEQVLHHADQSAHLLAAIDSVRTDVAGLKRSVEDFIASYSRIAAELLACVAAVVRTADDPELVRLTAAHFAFLQAKEEVGLEGAYLICAFAAGSLAPRQDVALAARVAAQESYLTLFTAAAPPTIVSAYRERTNDPVFEEVARLERIAMRGSERLPLGGNASASVQSITAKLDRLQGVADVHSGEIFARARALEEP